MIDRTVFLQVGEHTYHLKPTLDAMRKVNRAHGSIREALERVRAGDFDVVCSLIAAGAGITTAKQIETLQERVFNNGVLKTAGAVTEFLGVLANPAGDELEDEDPEGNP